MTKEEAIIKLRHYCSYQERCHQEVRSKLLRLNIFGDWLEETMSQLIDEGYLNEERFAINFARGKYRIKGWGKIRITNELKIRKVSVYCIRKAMKVIDEEGGYEKRLEDHLIKYIGQRKGKYTIPNLRQKTYRYGLQKGFESSIVRDVVAKIFIKVDKL